MTKWDKNIFPASALLVGQSAAAGSPLFLFAEFTAFLPRGSVGGFQLPMKKNKTKQYNTIAGDVCVLFCFFLIETGLYGTTISKPGVQRNNSFSSGTL